MPPDRVVVPWSGCRGSSRDGSPRPVRVPLLLLRRLLSSSAVEVVWADRVQSAGGGGGEVAGASSGEKDEVATTGDWSQAGGRMEWMRSATLV